MTTAKTADATSRTLWPRGVSADAGSGKTYELMESLVALLRREGEQQPDPDKQLNVDQVACITFTRNAAGELWARAYARLEDERRDAEEDPDPGRSAAYWNEQIHRMAGAPFCTLHSLANLIVQEAPLQIGGGVRNEFLEEDACRELMARAANEAIRGLPARWEDPAAATLLRYGTVDYDFQKGLPSILSSLAFRALADGLDYHDLIRLAEESFRPVVQEEGADGAPAPQAGEPLSPRERGRGEGAAAQGASSSSTARSGREAQTGRDVSPASSLTSGPSPGGRGENGAAEWRAFGRVFMETLWKTMVRYRELRGPRLDFGEVLVFARNLLRDDAELRRRIGERFRYIFLDEAQDTDPVQLEMVYYLSGSEAPLPESVDWSRAEFGPRLVMVGDIKQSIYRWRSAEPRIFVEALRRFESAGQLYELSANWRALPRLVAAYQALGEFCVDPLSRDRRAPARQEVAQASPPADDVRPCGCTTNLGERASLPAGGDAADAERLRPDGRTTNLGARASLPAGGDAADGERLRPDGRTTNLGERASLPAGGDAADGERLRPDGRTTSDSACRRYLAHPDEMPVAEQMREGPEILWLKPGEPASSKVDDARAAEARAVAVFVQGLVSGELEPPGGLAVYEDDPGAPPVPGGGRVQRPVMKDGRPAFQYRDFLVLSRQHKTLAPLVAAFKRLGVPFHLPEQTGLYSKPEILDAVAPFRAAARPKDGEALLALLRGPVFACAEDELVGILNEDESPCLGDLLHGEKPWARRLHRRAGALVELVGEFADRALRDRPADLLHEWMDRSALREIYASLPGGQAALANMDKLREVWIARFADGDDLDALVRRAEWGFEGYVSESEGPVYGAASDAVRLMTVHKAKGLQAPIVIVMGMGEKVRQPEKYGAQYTRDRGVVAAMPKESAFNPTGEHLPSAGMAAYLESEVKPYVAQPPPAVQKVAQASPLAMTKKARPSDEQGAGEQRTGWEPVQPNPYAGSVKDGALHQDERRLFYVALTRARDALILASDLYMAGRQKKGLEQVECWGNWARWLAHASPERFALEEVKMAFAQEAADWDALPDPPAEPPAPPESLPVRRYDRWDGPMLAFRAAKAEAMKGAEALRGEAPKSGDEEAERAATAADDRVALGVLAHEYLAEADWPLEALDDGLLERMAGAFGLDARSPEVAALADDLRALMADERFRRMAAQAESAMREANFLHMPPDAEYGLRGAIDLVLVMDQAKRKAAVVDYKYAPPPASDALHPGYQAQLQAYADALEAAGWQVEGASLVYFRGGVLWVDA